MTIPIFLFVTYKGDRKPIIPTKIFVTYKKSEFIHVSLSADTSVKKANQVTADFDTTALRTYEANVHADVSRFLIKAGGLDADIVRSISHDEASLFDTTRVLSGSVYEVTFAADTVIAANRTDNIAADVGRKVQAANNLETDTDRIIASSANLQADTLRQTTGTIFNVSFSADLIRSQTRETILNADTDRSTNHKYTIDGDMVRQVPYTAKGLNPQSISINLEKGQLSESFEMVTPYDLPLDSSITGRLLDFDYNFKVYQTSGTGLMRTITGMYDVDKLFYTPFTYTLSKGRHSAKDHARNIAKMLGKSLYWAADDFISSETFDGIGGATIQNMISGLFGWAGNLPQDWINVMLRGNTLKIVQRGHEPNTIDLTHTKHSRPSIDRRLMRSVWSGTAGGHSARHITIEPLGFYGTIRYGESMVTYVDGLVTREVTKTAEGTTTSTYDYSDGYLTKKVTVTPDETITTTYEYAITLNDRYLASEKAVTKDKDGNTTSETLTQHVYLGNGWYGTTVYVDGEFNNSSVSNGKPGGKASKYIVDQSNLNLGGKYPDNSGESYQGAALFDTSFPISDTATLKKLTKDIEWLNRKTEEKVSMDIWQYPHLIDFTDKILFNGAAYFLESNQVTQTPRELKQTVTMIRWY